MDMEVSSTWKPVTRRRIPDDEFFLDGDILCSYNYDKQLLELGDNTGSCELDSIEDFTCGTHNCNKRFNSLTAYDIHYNSVHRNKCSTCKRSFPTSHLLDIHLTEAHDPMFEVKAKAKPMYQCLVPSCEEWFHSREKRKNHLIKTHKFPASYRFDRLVKKSKKPTTAMSELKESQTETETMDTEQTVASSEEKENHKPPTEESGSMEGQAHVSESGRKFVYKVPKSFSFGQGAQKVFQRPAGGSKKKGKKKHWHQQNSNEDTRVNIEEVQMRDLEDALS